MNWYNDHDPFACAWLRELIKAGQLPEGEVDDRSILDVEPDDLRPFRQCHFFAGIGGWPHALQLAGWPEDREVWTGSPPCQPFSVAGQGKADNDHRDLWPAFHRLIAERRPAVVFGEQVSGKLGYQWLAGVRFELERDGYRVGAANLPACGVSAPHRRERLYWCALANAERDGRSRRNGQQSVLQEPHDHAASPSEGSGAVADAGIRRGRGREIYPSGERRDEFCHGSQGNCMADAGQAGRGEHPQRDGQSLEPDERASCGRDAAGRGDGGVADASALAGRCHVSASGYGSEAGREVWLQGAHRGSGGDGGVGDAGEQRLAFSERLAGTESGAPGSTARQGPGGAGFWDDAEWRVGADGKARRVEPGVCLLAHGVSNRVGKLRGLGNAIVAPLAALFIEAVMGEPT